MTFADTLILVALFLPYGSITIAKWLARERFNNADPRNKQTYMGAALRAKNAHANGLETFPFFAVAVIFAEFRAAPQLSINGLAAVYILLRLVYIWAYISGRPMLRSWLFVVGFVIAVVIFMLPGLNFS